MKRKRNIAFISAAVLFLIGVILIIVGFSNRNEAVTLAGGFLCGGTPCFCIVIFIFSMIFGGNNRRGTYDARKSEKPLLYNDTKTGGTYGGGDEEYDAVFDRECDFIDWLMEQDETDIHDEYLDKAYELWDLYTGRDGDDTLDKLTALLDEYETRAGYTRRTDTHIDSNIDSKIESETSGEHKAVDSRRKKLKLGCLFPIFFVVMFVITIVFFTRNMVTAGLISFFSIFGGTVIFISSLFIRERIIFSTKIDPDKYEFRNGVVEECYCSGTTKVNSRTYKTYVLTLNVDGKEVTAYARRNHIIGETVHLAVRKDKPLAKLVDSDGKAIYCYKYDYNTTLDSAKSATVGMAKTTEIAPSANSYKSTRSRPYEPAPLRSEVIIPTRAVEDLCEKENKLADALESRGLFAVSDEYRKEAETHWNEYQGGSGDDDEFILSWIGKLIDAYTAMYIYGKMSAPPSDSYAAVTAPAEDDQSADNEKAQAILSVADAIRSVATKKEKEAKADAVEKAEIEHRYINTWNTPKEQETAPASEIVAPLKSENSVTPVAETKEEEKSFASKNGIGAGRRIGYRPTKRKK